MSELRTREQSAEWLEHHGKKWPDVAEVHKTIVALYDQVNALQAELARLRPMEEFLKAIPGPIQVQDDVWGTCGWLCPTCDMMDDSPAHKEDCLWLRAQKLLHPAGTDTEEGK